MFHLALMIKQPIILLEQNDLFYENGYYKIENEMLFQPPEYNKRCCTTFIMQIVAW
jgi:hypothetical protein